MTIQSVLEGMGFNLTSALVRDDFNGTDGSHTFAIAIIKNGQLFATEYSAGCANRHMRNGRPIPSMPMFGLDKGKRYVLIERRKKSIPNKPTLVEVMSCLIMDAKCVADGQTFEDFASDMGYDEDSRKAESAYHACCATERAFRRFNVCLNELSELFQDY